MLSYLTHSRLESVERNNETLTLRFFILSIHLEPNT